MTTETTCSRPGCSKKLRSNNTTGRCATNCQSPEAPPSHRAAGVDGVDGARAPRKSTTRAEPAREAGSALAKFRLVVEALGRDPDAVLEEFAGGWLEALAQKLDEEG
jgi:hypothetical protein